MKKIFFLAVLSSLLTVSLWAGPFEGVINVKYNSYNGSDVMNDCHWYFKGDQCKFEVTVPVKDKSVNTCLIPRLSDKHLIVFSNSPAEDGKQYYSEVDLTSVKPDPAFVFSRVEIEKGTEAKSLNGYDCTHYIVRTDRSITDMWIAPIEVSFVKFASFFPSNYELIGMSKKSISGFPMKSVTKDLAGNVIADFEVTSLVKKTFNAADFSIPAGYLNYSDHRE